MNYRTIDPFALPSLPLLSLSITIALRNTPCIKRRMTESNETPESRHSVTDPDKCRDLEKKYGWRLLRLEPTKDKILKVDCIFKGKTEFPNYQQED